jgi:hypothetical protein
MFKKAILIFSLIVLSFCFAQNASALSMMVSVKFTSIQIPARAQIVQYDGSNFLDQHTEFSLMCQSIVVKDKTANAVSGDQVVVGGISDVASASTSGWIYRGAGSYPDPRTSCSSDTDCSTGDKCDLLLHKCPGHGFIIAMDYYSANAPYHVYAKVGNTGFPGSLSLCNAGGDALTNNPGGNVYGTPVQYLIPGQEQNYLLSTAWRYAVAPGCDTNGNGQYIYTGSYPYTYLYLGDIQ